MFTTTTRRVGAALVSVAAVSALALGAPAVATAAPAVPAAPAKPAVPTAVSPNTVPIPNIPFDGELAAGLRMIKQAGIDKIAIEAAKAIIGTVGQLSVSQATASPVAATTDPLAILKALGITPLSPSIAPMCTTPTADNPFGLVAAGAGAAKGPWPLRITTPILPLNLPTAKIDPNLVKDGSTAYAFLPAGAGGTGGKMQVAWFNTTTLKGGFADLTSVAANNPLLALIPGVSGLRLAPVETGKGTVLSAVYGTAQVGSRSCYFLPAVGVV
ncbi:hypothetical protein HH308_12705 [Gordonia sp. TBRC 11910]|uniref:Secreted protein n=1 Tax=Gordonia asplenii TaxID=2725283 RepID=A0A848KUY1_9ACTN|nr:hypothetical protein [Gordonia asplenii]NMO02072.1 hypothetical protein [Gordonia asplenii]